VRLLLDTHTLVWALAEPERLSLRARTAIASSANEAFVSMASAWELAILEGLSRVTLGAPLATVFTARLAAMRFRLLPIQLQHLAALAGLPQHHRDPFDRLLVATAVAERLTLVSSDARFGAYDATVLW
jgi:PIN domain nuclease of toxin-antitoxin system